MVMKLDMEDLRGKGYQLQYQPLSRVEFPSNARDDDVIKKLKMAE